MVGLIRYFRWVLVLAMLGIAYLDYSTGKDPTVWGLYLIPVGLASWASGIRAGIFLSVLSCVLMFVAGIYGGNRFDSTGFFLLGIFNRFLALLLVSWLASYLFRKQMLESTLKSYEECMDYMHVSPKQAPDDEAAASEDEVPGSIPGPPPDRGH